MIITALRELGADPSFVNGGVIESLGVSSARGEGEIFVVEADESDGSFLLYDTAVALVTNVDADHLDHYGTREAFDAAFVQFANAASELVVTSSDDAGAIAAISEFARLFLAPGVNHCGGGPGPDTFDALGALEAWVEHGTAPEQMTASHQTNGAVDRTRPLCAYPRTAAYVGSGSTDEAKNFSCRMP